MIYTVTFNPALDYIVHVDNFEEGMTNRSHDEELYCGGKGVNVSFVLKQLGFETGLDMKKLKVINDFFICVSIFKIHHIFYCVNFFSSFITAYSPSKIIRSK